VSDAIAVVGIAVMAGSSIDVLVSLVGVDCIAVMITVLWVGVTALFWPAHMV
jgi:hypothetical protein